MAAEALAAAVAAPGDAAAGHAALQRLAQLPPAEVLQFGCEQAPLLVAFLKAHKTLSAAVYAALAALPELGQSSERWRALSAALLREGLLQACSDTLLLGDWHVTFELVYALHGPSFCQRRLQAAGDAALQRPSSRLSYACLRLALAPAPAQPACTACKRAAPSWRRLHAPSRRPAWPPASVLQSVGTSRS